MAADDTFTRGDYERFITQNIDVTAAQAHGMMNAFIQTSRNAILSGKRIVLENLYVIQVGKIPAKVSYIKPNNATYLIPQRRTLEITGAPNLLDAINGKAHRAAINTFGQVPDLDGLYIDSLPEILRNQERRNAQAATATTIRTYLITIMSMTRLPAGIAYQMMNQYQIATFEALTRHQRCTIETLHSIDARKRATTNIRNVKTGQLQTVPSHYRLHITIADPLNAALNTAKTVRLYSGQKVTTPPPAVSAPDPTDSTTDTPPEEIPPTEPDQVDPEPPQDNADTDDTTEPDNTPEEAPAADEPPPDLPGEPIPGGSTGTAPPPPPPPPPPQPDAYFPYINPAYNAELIATPGYQAARDRIAYLHSLDFYRDYELDGLHTNARTAEEITKTVPVLMVTKARTYNGQPPFYFDTEIWTWAHN